MSSRFILSGSVHYATLVPIRILAPHRFREIAAVEWSVTIQRWPLVRHDRYDVDLNEHALKRQPWHRDERPSWLPVTPYPIEFLPDDLELLIIVADDEEIELGHVRHRGAGGRKYGLRILQGLFELGGEILRQNPVFGLAALSCRKDQPAGNSARCE